MERLTEIEGLLKQAIRDSDAELAALIVKTAMDLGAHVTLKVNAERHATIPAQPKALPNECAEYPGDYDKDSKDAIFNAILDLNEEDCDVAFELSIQCKSIKEALYYYHNGQKNNPYYRAGDTIAWV